MLPHGQHDKVVAPRSNIFEGFLHGQEAAMFEQLLNELAGRPAVQGITMVDLLDLPAPLGAALRRIVRADTLPLSDLAAELALNIDEARALGALLVEKGMLTVEAAGDGEPAYRVRFVVARRSALPAGLLKALEEE
jgi:hypothetical protein